MWRSSGCVHSSFFFSSRRRHTRFSRDWSSDVCSSDLFEGRNLFADDSPLRAAVARHAPDAAAALYDLGAMFGSREAFDRGRLAKDRKSVVEGNTVERGGRREIQKTTVTA